MLILSSKSYVSKQGAKVGINSVRHNAPDAQVKDLTWIKAKPKDNILKTSQFVCGVGF